TARTTNAASEAVHRTKERDMGPPVGIVSAVSVARGVVSMDPAVSPPRPYYPAKHPHSEKEQTMRQFKKTWGPLSLILAAAAVAGCGSTASAGSGQATAAATKDVKTATTS